MFALSRLPVYVFIGINLSVSLLARAETITLTPTKDNTLIEMAKGDRPRSNGLGDSIYSGRVGFFGDGTLRRAVLAFDIAGEIPSGAAAATALLQIAICFAAGRWTAGSS